MLKGLKKADSRDHEPVKLHENVYENVWEVILPVLTVAGITPPDA